MKKGDTCTIRQVLLSKGFHCIWSGEKINDFVCDVLEQTLM